MLDLNEFMHIGIHHYIALSLILFAVGMMGVMIRTNVLIILMSIELMLNAVNLSFVTFSHYNKNFDGQIIVFFVMTIAAAEAAVGLALVVLIFKHVKTLNVRFFEKLRG